MLSEVIATHQFLPTTPHLLQLLPHYLVVTLEVLDGLEGLGGGLVHGAVRCMRHTALASFSLFTFFFLFHLPKHKVRTQEGIRRIGIQYTLIFVV